MSESGDQLKRKRARVACEPCRQRKRKCNGATPCATCTDWGYNCHYTDQTPRKRRLSQPSSAATAAKPSSPAAAAAVGGESLRSPDEAVTQSHHHQGIARSLEANSAAAFVRKMGLKVDPAQAPKLALFGWNIGARQLPSGTGAISARPIVDVISVADMKQLAEVYFTKIDPCYGFIDRRVFDDRLKTRWQTPLSSGSIYDSILAGVAALGSLFSHRSMTITELHLVEAARSILDGHDGSGPPSLELVTGWALRVVYMRMTAAPHATWIASSTLMHLIEAAGLHLEPSSSSSATSHDTVPLRAPATTPPHDREISRRLVGVAHHLNIWTSFDLGLSRVAFRTGLPLPASPTNPGDYTPEVLNLLPASACLDPENSQTDSDLEPTLTKVLQGTHTQPPSVMAQTNLVLCILRRLRILNLSITPQVTDQVLVLFGQALSYARTMVTDGSPWHQVANVPMQILYVLLEMDTRASLAMLPAAMQTVTLVATTYDTATMREAYSTARLLVSLYQQRRSEDTRVLAEVLNLAPGAGETVTEPLSPRVDELSWLEGLVAEMPSLQGLELEPWLQGDVLAGGEGWE